MRARGQRRWWPTRQPDATETSPAVGVDRRAMLLGAVATAGVVAASGASSADAPSRPASPGAPGSRSGRTVAAASEVSVVPAGEIVDADVQAVLEALDRRLGKAHLIDDLQVAMTLVDDFMGSGAATNQIGALGWALGVGATGTAAAGAVVNEPGVFAIGTGRSASGWQNLNLGNSNLRGGPVLMAEWRARVNSASSASDAFSCWVGLHNDRTGEEPATGFYFRHSPDDGGTWRAVCADDGNHSDADTGRDVDNLFHRFRITCDGSGVARFYIDSELVATVQKSVPSDSWYAPSVSIRKSAGTAPRVAAVDYFALRYEHAR